MPPSKTDDETILKMLNEGKTQKEIAEHFGVSAVAICKRVKKLLPEPESLKRLTEKEKRFVVAKAGGKTQTQAALDAYDVSSRSVAKSMGSELMRRQEIKIAVADLMHQEGLTKRYRVKKLKQHVDHPDPNVSLKALDQSWKLDGAYGQESHVEVNILEVRERRERNRQRLAELAEEAGMSVEELTRRALELPDEAVGSS